MNGKMDRYIQRLMNTFNFWFSTFSLTSMTATLHHTDDEIFLQSIVHPLSSFCCCTYCHWNFTLIFNFALQYQRNVMFYCHFLIYWFIECFTYRFADSSMVYHIFITLQNLSCRNLGSTDPVLKLLSLLCRLKI